MTIEFYKKSVYGNDLMYIKDKEMAIKFSSLIGTKTITISQMEKLSDLFGCEFIQVLN